MTSRVTLTERNLRSASVISATVLCLLEILVSPSLAQVLPAHITPSGLGTQVNPSLAPPPGKIQYDITGGMRAGTNLFHSFGNFNVPTNNIANFLNDSGATTSNILGRVTGGNASNIFGTIQTTGFGNANLFLMNPAGFLFGPTATLNVGGMVTFTTADYIKLADRVRFNAVPNVTADGLLSTAPVAAFGFLGSNPGAITVQGSQLSVPTGQGISLIGGNITIQNGTLEKGAVQSSHLSAPNGQINLATAASPGEFLQNLTAAPNVNGASFTSFGSLHLTQGSTVDMSQTVNGQVLIRGGQFVMEVKNALLNTGDGASPAVTATAQDSIILRPGSSILTSTSSAERGPDVQIVADLIQLTGIPARAPTATTPGVPPIPTVIRTSAGGSGDAGNINMTANRGLELNAATVSSASQSPATGNAGSINLTSAEGNISITNFSQVTSQTINSPGNVGAIIMSAPQGDIALDRGAVFTHIQGPGPVGGSGGRIEISGNNLTLLNQGGVSVDNFNPRVPENLTVNLSSSLNLDGRSFIQTISRGPALAAANANITAHDINIKGASFLNTQTISSGHGGELNVFTENLQLTNGGQLKSGSIIGPDPLTGRPTTPSGAGGTINIKALTGFTASVLIDGPGSGIFTNTQGTGLGGNTNIVAQSVTVQNGGTISASTAGTAASATGGNIAITANQLVTLNDGASITANSTGPANAGNIVVNAGQNFTSTNSAVTTSASQASGGNITVTASDMVHLTNSQINASVQGAQTTVGGNIVIDPNFVILQNGQILAQATQGQGGNISITTNSLLSDVGSLISASSQSGVNGTVTVQSPISQAGGKIIPLSKTTLETTALLSQRCAALTGGQYSSFVIAGRDVLPMEPGQWLAGPLAELTGTTDSTAGLDGLQTSSVSPSGEPIVSVRRMPPGGALTRFLETDWLIGCDS